MAVDFGPRPGRESGIAITAADRLDEPFMVPDNQRLRAMNAMTLAREEAQWILSIAV
jgi:hypothetical protein